MSDQKIRPAVFLDRDGVLNFNREDYVKSLDELQIFPFAGDAVAKLNRAGFLVVVVSNQQGVGKGLVSLETLGEIEKTILNAIEPSGGHIEAFYYCPHLKLAQCECRKPRAGNIQLAAEHFKIDMERSYFVGDSKGDIGAAHSAGLKMVLVLCGKVRPQDVPNFADPPEAIATDIADAADWIVRDFESGREVLQ